MQQAVQFLLGFLGAASGAMALVIDLKTDPFYSMLASVQPSTRRLLSARESLANRDRLRIADYQEELETIHEMLVEEYDFDKQYTPVELKFHYNGFKLRYAEQRSQGKKNSPGIGDELVEHMDERIDRRIGRIALAAAGVCVVSFGALLVSSLI